LVLVPANAALDKQVKCSQAGDFKCLAPSDFHRNHFSEILKVSYNQTVTESEAPNNRLYAASAVTPTGLFLIGGNVEALEDPDTVHFMHITKQPADFWHKGPEPEINRGIKGASAVVLDIDIYLMGGFDQLTKEYALFHH
jgi:N-acetylneuraminic acid mutarotase